MKKKQGFALAGLLIAAAVMFGVWHFTQAGPQTGVKHITVEVVHGNGAVNRFTYETEEEYLGALLQKEGLIRGTEDQFGLFVDTVDGEMAVYAENQSWWNLSCNGESAQTGVDQVLIVDGSTYTWTYTIG